MSDADYDKRLRALENKVSIAAGSALVFAAWFGIANFYYIPNSVKSAVESTATGETANDMKKILEKAKVDYEQISKFANEKTLKIDGQCFKPNKIYLCDRDNKGSYFST